VGDPQAIVRDFLDAWDEPDLDRLVERLSAFITEDAVLRQMPFGEVRGRAGIRRIAAESMETMSQFEIDIVAVDAAGRKVFTERVDRFVLHGRAVAVPVLGVFELADDDRISAWRDYFDPRPLLPGVGSRRPEPPGPPEPPG
jgi:limonene-1,2-epoxide hydrolase